MNVLVSSMGICIGDENEAETEDEDEDARRGFWACLWMLLEEDDEDNEDDTTVSTFS